MKSTINRHSVFGVFHLVALCICFITSLPAQTDDPEALVRQADRFADAYNWDDAGPLYARAEDLYVASGQNRNALYAKLGRIRGSMQAQSLPELSDYLAGQLDSSLVQNDRELKLRCLTVKGDVDGEIDSSLAIPDWTEVLAMAWEIGDKRLEFRATGELALFAFMQGNIADAKRGIAAAIVGAHERNDVGAQIRFLAATGTGLALVNAYAEALQYLDRALALAKSNPDAGTQFVLYWGKVKALIGLKRTREAQELLDAILATAREKDKRVKVAEFLITSATIAESSGAHTRAVDLLNESVQVSTSGGFRRLLEDAEFRLVDVFGATGELGKAEKAAEAGLEAARSSGETYSLPQRLTTLAALKLRLNKPMEAEELYSQATDVIEGMLLNAHGTPTAINLLTSLSDTYVAHFALAADQLHNVDGAFEILERVRGRALTDLLRSGRPRGPVISSSAERQINHLRMQLVTAKSPRDRKAALQSLFFANQAMEANSSVYPNPPTKSDHSVVPITLAMVRSQLGSNELLLEFVLGEQASYSLVVTRSTARIVRLPGRQRLETLVDAHLKAVESSAGVAVEPARALYRSLFERIPEIRAHKRVVVVPDGKLHLLPFSSLIDESGHFLINSYVFSYAPSGTSFYLLATERRPKETSNTFLGIGGVHYRSRDSKSTPPAMTASATRGSGMFDGGLANLQPLPGSEDEVRGISRILRGGKILIGEDATKAMLKSLPLEDFRVLHFAAHAKADPKSPDNAALILGDDPVTHEDGYLDPGEIARLRLNADLVTLSACETAVGRLQGEVGVSNIASAFLYAGARSVVSTLWPIDDNFSSYLMARFYQHLTEGEGKADALTLAQRDLIGHFGPRAVPLYWAPFILIGEPDSAIAGLQAKRTESR